MDLSAAIVLQTPTPRESGEKNALIRDPPTFAPQRWWCPLVSGTCLISDRFRSSSPPVLPKVSNQGCLKDIRVGSLIQGYP